MDLKVSNNIPALLTLNLNIQMSALRYQVNFDFLRGSFLTSTQMTLGSP